jgi:hypothetical protein
MTLALWLAPMNVLTGFSTLTTAVMVCLFSSSDRRTPGQSREVQLRLICGRWICWVATLVAFSGVRTSARRRPVTTTSPSSVAVASVAI